MRMERAGGAWGPLWAHCYWNVVWSLSDIPFTFMGSFNQWIFLKPILCASAIPSHSEAYCLVEAGWLPLSLPFRGLPCPLYLEWSLLCFLPLTFPLVSWDFHPCLLTLVHPHWALPFFPLFPEAPVIQGCCMSPALSVELDVVDGSQTGNCLQFMVRKASWTTSA